MTLAPPAPVVLEKGPWNNSNGLEAESVSCVRGRVFRHRATGKTRPFRCGTCPDCVREYGRRFRRGLHRAIVASGLSSLLTLTLPAEYHDPGTAADVVRARRFATKALDRFWARLRRKGILGDSLWVEEAHRDGTVHLHVAYNDAAVRAAFGNDWAAVRAYLQRVAYDSGFGFIDWSVGKGRNPRALAAELAKYLAKTFAPVGKGRPPWRDVYGCTVDDGFQRPRFHRWGGSRAASKIVRESIRGPRKAKGEWELVAEVHPRKTRPWRCVRCELVHDVDAPPSTCAADRGGCGRTLEGRLEGHEIVDWTEFVPAAWTRDQVAYYADVAHVDERPRLLGHRYEPWSPGRSVATVPGCTFHFPDPALPFRCHHLRLETELGCWCVPPWTFERPWTPARLAERLARTEPAIGPYDVVDPNALAVLESSVAFEPGRGQVTRRAWIHAGLRVFAPDRRRRRLSCSAPAAEIVPTVELIPAEPPAAAPSPASGAPSAGLPICAGCARLLIPGAPVLALEDGRTFHDVPGRRCRT